MLAGPDVAGRRQALVPHPWTWLDQVHGSDVVFVDVPGACCGARADAAVTTVAGAVLSVATADCAPVLMWSADPEVSVVAAAHAGWRGLYDGVLERTVEAMRSVGCAEIGWKVGPCISAAAYEFGEADLTTMALRFGPDVVAATADGRPALDLAAAVWSAMGSAGVDLPPRCTPPCTATATDDSGAPRYFSWRARRDVGRQASLIWIEP